MKYRKKPIIINAIQWRGDNLEDITKFDPFFEGIKEPINMQIIIQTLEGVMKADIGDYIIRGIKDELYPCKPDIFESTYEKI